MSLAGNIAAVVTQIGAAIKGARTTVPTRTVTGDYALTAADAGYEVLVNAATAAQITVPPDFGVGSVALVRAVGTGQVTIAGASGVTLRTASTGKLRAQYSVAAVRLDSTAVAYVSGDLAST